MDSSSRRLPLRDLKGDGVDLELEEGEYVPGHHESSDDDTDDDGGYPLQPRREGTLPSEGESDDTISDDDNPTAVSSAVVSTDPRPPARRFACHVCGRRFTSPKAVDGHMRVHGNAHHAAAAAVSGGWAVTGKRGWSGGKPSSVADSLNSVSNTHPSDSIPMAIAITNLPPKPAVLSTRSSLPGEGSSSDSTQPTHMAMAATLVSGAADPSITGGVIAHQQAAPPPASEPARPVHHPAVPPAAAPQQAQPPAMARRPAQPPREYTCKLCGKSYSTHQRLGGHAAGHRNRQNELEAAAAAVGMMAEDGGGGGGCGFLAALRRGGRRAEERHECRKCHKVFHTGVALGGHMRMHYTGPPIVHKKHRKPAAMGAAVSEADLRLALSTMTEERRPPAPAVAGRVRLFGIDIDIGQKEQAPPPSEQLGSGEAEGSSSAANEQQQ